MLEQDDLKSLCHGLVSAAYVDQGVQELQTLSKGAKALLSTRRLPEGGWSEAAIERLLADLASMDSNNFEGNAGVGEREGRVACPMVARRHCRLAHGIGRSGDISAEQPKAAGSTLLARICHFLVLDALHMAGLSELAAVQVYPLATGMALTCAFLACAATRPVLAGARFVIWSRIDQKTCLKAITASNLEPVVIEPHQQGDAVATDPANIRSAVERLGSSKVACVVTTTSCFAPRTCDDVEAVARLCAEYSIPHVINNAYGVQSAALCARVSAACRVGRVDVVVQSTDKNFMVPVGGAVVAAPKASPQVLRAMSQLYPGRAAVAAHLDLTMTLLWLGKQGWCAKLREREALAVYLQAQMDAVAAEMGERRLASARNPISYAMTLDGLAATSCSSKASPGLNAAPTSRTSQQLDAPNASRDRAEEEQVQQTKLPATSSLGHAQESGAEADPGSSGDVITRSGAAPVCSAGEQRAVTRLGAMLWQRRVSGVRVVPRGKEQTVAGCGFEGYGSSCKVYPHHYMTAAAALGGTKAEVDLFVRKVRRTYALCQRDTCTTTPAP